MHSVRGHKQRVSNALKCTYLRLEAKTQGSRLPEIFLYTSFEITKMFFFYG
jgi:hypothetical protein